MKNKETEMYSQMKIIESFKATNPRAFLKAFLSITTAKEREDLISIFRNEEIRNEFINIFNYMTENYKWKNIEDFIINIHSNLEKLKQKIPKDFNIEKYQPLLDIFQNILDRGENVKHNIAGKNTIIEDFGIDYDTLNEWLIYFEKENFVGKRSFNSKEYSFIIKDFINVNDEITIENIKRYHFKTYNKIKIAEIIGDVAKSEKTNYDNLWKKIESIDDLNPKNTKLLNWIKKHHKMPFSLAYQLVSLIIETLPENEKIEINDIFESYFET
ncbi:hypothetical protein [Epilithonimonas arachidiradicis]|uniref:Uncharacterized protein n=3 Tax=Epilithonimonas arachidiradicis TaxID=1617282 RepID=A0ABQ1X787_9FLAO|nr:hypothetical protein [Epilithonimonas arachidiradicis]GGG63824.1 hypothetical protein GCM10007332_27560 [Epilithonimonas arachidiradicis]